MKKILLTLGSVATVAAPIMAVVSCGDDSTTPATPAAQNPGAQTPQKTPAQIELEKIVKDSKVVFPSVMATIGDIFEAIKSNNFGDYLNNIAHKFEEAAKITKHAPLFGTGFDVAAIRADSTKVEEVATKLENLIKSLLPKSPLVDTAMTIFKMKDVLVAAINQTETISAMSHLIGGLNLESALASGAIEGQTSASALRGYLDNLLGWNKIDDNATISMTTKLSFLDSLKTYDDPKAVAQVDFTSGEKQLFSETTTLDALQQGKKIFTDAEVNYTAPAGTHRSMRAAAPEVDIMGSLQNPNVQTMLSGIIARLLSYNFMHIDTGKNKDNGLLNRLHKAIHSLGIHKTGAESNTKMKKYGDKDQYRLFTGKTAAQLLAAWDAPFGREGFTFGETMANRTKNMAQEFGHLKKKILTSAEETKVDALAHPTNPAEATRTGVKDAQFYTQAEKTFITGIYEKITPATVVEDWSENPLSFVDWNIGTSDDAARKVKYADFLNVLNQVPEYVEYTNTNTITNKFFLENTINNFEMNKLISIKGMFANYLADPVNSIATLKTLVNDIVDGTYTLPATKPTTPATAVAKYEMAESIIDAVDELNKRTTALTTTELKQLISDAIDVQKDSNEASIKFNAIRENIARFDFKANTLIPLVDGISKTIIDPVPTNAQAIDSAVEPTHEVDVDELKMKELVQAFDADMLSKSVIDILENGISLIGKGLFTLRFDFDNLNTMRSIDYKSHYDFTDVLPQISQSIEDNFDKSLDGTNSAGGGGVHASAEYEVFETMLQDIAYGTFRAPEILKMFQELGMNEAALAVDSPSHRTFQALKDYAAFATAHPEYKEIFEGLRVKREWGPMEMFINPANGQLPVALDATTWNTVATGTSTWGDLMMHNLRLQRSAMTYEELTRFMELTKKATNTLTADEIAFVSAIMDRAAHDITLGRTKLAELINHLKTDATFNTAFKNDYLTLINLFATSAAQFAITLENINEIFN